MDINIKEYLDNNINIIPLNPDKTPAIRSWSQYMKKMYDGPLDNFESLGIVCGPVSNGIEVVDVDCKYDLRGTLLERYKKIVDFNDKTIWDKLVIQKTINDGYHIIYRTNVRTKNQKLAKRPTTPEEQINNRNDKFKVLIETRGEGGYIVAYPSEGYTVIQGDIFNPPLITDEQREVLMCAAISLDEVPNDVFKPAIPHWRSKGKTPWEDFDERGDVISLLQVNGWKLITEKGDRVFFQRPGNTTAKTSAHYHKGLRLFKCFSTSTAFDNERGYTPSAVYAILNCNGDFSQAAKELLGQGYGELPEKEYQNDIEVFSDEFQITDYLSDNDEDREMIERYCNDLLPVGLSTGYKVLDEYFRFKPASLNLNLGHDGVGKSTIIWMLALISAVLHKWRWVIYSSENQVWVIKKEMTEWLVGKKIKACSDMERDKAIDYIDKNFKFITFGDGMSYNQVLSVAEYLLGQSKYDALLIDPYNTLEYNWEGLDRRMGTHEYHHHVMSVFKRWTANNNCAIFVNLHAVTEAMRRVYTSGEMKGFVEPPRKSDAEGGGKFAAKTDNFLISHRFANHEKYKKYNLIYVEKIKEEWSGGKRTIKDKPIKLELKYHLGFRGFFDEQNNCPLLGKFREICDIGTQKEFEETDPRLENFFDN